MENRADVRRMADNEVRRYHDNENNQVRKYREQLANDEYTTSDYSSYTDDETSYTESTYSNPMFNQSVMNNSTSNQSHWKAVAEKSGSDIITRTGSINERNMHRPYGIDWNNKKPPHPPQQTTIRAHDHYGDRQDTGYVNYLKYRNIQTPVKSGYHHEDSGYYENSSVQTSNQPLYYKSSYRQRPVNQEYKVSQINQDRRYHDTYPQRPKSYPVSTERQLSRLQINPQKRHVGVQMNTQYIIENEKPQCYSIGTQISQPPVEKIVEKIVQQEPKNIPKRHVGIQMTTEYVVKKPKCKSAGTQCKKTEYKTRGTQSAKVKTTSAGIQTEAEPEKPRKKRVPKMKSKSNMTRVGGGWMKVEHHRYHHIPLTVYEHPRAFDGKFLYTKSKYTPDKERVPIAYKKYREMVVRNGKLG